MAGEGHENALARIDAALARIEAAVQRPRQFSSNLASSDLEARHQRLRSAVSQSLSQLDALIAGQGR